VCFFTNGTCDYDKVIIILLYDRIIALCVLTVLLTVLK